MARVNRMWTTMAAGLLLALATGCPQPPPSVDEPASNLDATINVLDLSAAPTDNALDVLVTFAKGGNAVTLSNGKVTCNGIELTLTTAGYEARIPLVAPGGSYVFEYTRNGENTPVGVVVPERPRIISPMTGATVRRDADFSVSYQVGSGSSVTATLKTRLIEATGGAQPDNGTATIPKSQLSNLSPGDGVLYFVRMFDNSYTDTAFHSVRVLYTSGAPDVTVSVQ